MTTPDDDAAFGKAMTLLSETFNEPMSAGRIQGYWIALEDLPIDAVCTAVHRALREQTDFFPKPGRLRELARPPRDYMLNADMYRPFRPIDRPALAAPVDMAALVTKALRDVEQATAEHRDAEAQARKPVDVDARKAELREQARRLVDTGKA